MGSRLDQLFAETFAGRTGHPGLQHYTDSGIVSTTFGELDVRASQMANELQRRGLAKGDRLLARLPNSAGFIELFLGCVRAGVILVPVNPQYRERELSHITRDAQPAAMVVDAGGGATLAGAANTWLVDDLVTAARSQAASPPATTVSADDPALIIYTSGTTGSAKGAVHTHSSLTANARSVVRAWRITARDNYLGVLPLFHVHGLANGILAWLATGCTMRLFPRFSHRDAEQQLTDFRPTLVFGVPTMYVRMLDDNVVSRAAARTIGGEARLFVSGSAPLPAHVHEAFGKKYGHHILERYGMTEALMITTNPYEGERRAGSVGRPFPGVDLRICDDAGHDCADDEAGEVLLRSPHLFAGYWRNEQATAEAHSDGWFRTGDVAVRGPDGYVSLRGRRGDLIISGGFNIYPREIEEVLLEQEWVAEAAVVGVADVLHGEVPVAYVVPRAGGEGDAAALEQLCLRQLARFKVPRKFVFVQELPRNVMGKLQKQLLPAP